MNQVSSQTMDRIFLGLTESLDTPVSLGLWLRYKYGEHIQLAETKIRPEWYNSVDLFRKDYLAVSYLSKYEGLQTGIDTHQVALTKFKASEEACQVVNNRIRKDRLRLKNIAVGSVILRAQRKILALIGDDPGDDWMSLCEWGPGATFSLKRKNAQVDKKVCTRPISITTFALRHFRKYISTDFQWLRALGIEAEGPVNLLDSNFEVVQGARYFTVPKDATGDRSALAEPTANAFLQSGVGRTLRKFLLKVGIDLTDQSRNRDAAASAVRKFWATVDLSSASDLISIEVVKTLLPERWFILLSDLRSGAYYHSKEWQTLHKFSSMGNGFTFELETLIFWALSQAVIDELGIKDEDTGKRARSIVYGDDIILPSGAYDLLENVFSALGFVINPKKSYANGQFRESCGAHYFMGKDVTPIYQKETLVDQFDPRGCVGLLERYRAANRLRRIALMWGGGIVCDDTFRTAWRRAAYGLPRNFVVPIDSEDNDGLALPFGEMDIRAYKPGNQTVYDRNYQSGMYCRVLSYRLKKRSALGAGMLVSTLHGMVSRASDDGPPPRSPREIKRAIARTLRIDESSPFWGEIPTGAIGNFGARWRHFPGEGSVGPWVSRGVSKETLLCE